MKMSILIINFLLLISTDAFTQSHNKIEPLFKFMQANADTTIVIEQVTNWATISPEAYFLSKKGDTLNCYIYRDLVYSRNFSILIPTNVRRSMRKVRERKIITEPMDVNEFFNVCAVNQKTLKKLWKQMNRIKPWTLNDDKVDGAGCSLDQDARPVIYDGGGLNLYLITASEIKLLYFYAPEFYEKHCKGRRGRESVLKIEALFRGYVQ